MPLSGPLFARYRFWRAFYTAIVPNLSQYLRNLLIIVNDAPFAAGANQHHSGAMIYGPLPTWFPSPGGPLKTRGGREGVPSRPRNDQCN